MDWKENVRRWRALSEADKRRIRLRRIPQKVANSMAFEGQPVDMEMLEHELHRLTRAPSEKADPSDEM